MVIIVVVVVVVKVVAVVLIKLELKIKTKFSHPAAAATVKSMAMLFVILWQTKLFFSPEGLLNQQFFVDILYHKGESITETKTLRSRTLNMYYHV